MLVILCRGAHHGRTADIDVFDGLFQTATRSGNGLVEGVKIHHHQFDSWNRRLFHRRHMLRHIPPRQDTGMNFRMQGFDAPVEHFRKTGVIANFGDRHTSILQQLGSAASGKYGHAELAQSEREFDNAALVGNTDQSLFDGHLLGCVLGCGVAVTERL